MAWRIEFDRSAERELARLDPVAAKPILTFLRHRVSPLDDPRVIVGIEDHALRILVVCVGNRREVYR